MRQEVVAEEQAIDTLGDTVFFKITQSQRVILELHLVSDKTAMMPKDVSMTVISPEHFFSISSFSQRICLCWSRRTIL